MWNGSTESVLPDVGTPSILNTFNFLTGKHNLINPNFELLNSESDPKHTRHANLSLVVRELITVKLNKIVKSGNTVLNTVCFAPL